MKENREFRVVLFRSVHHAMRAEKLLKETGLAVKLIPVPKEISSDCGVCICFSPEDLRKVVECLEGSVPYADVVPLQK